MSLKALAVSALRITWRGSAHYWERRYSKGGNSGAGSYGDVAKFKAATLNDLVEREGITTVVELGCGDGHQLTLANYPRYVGFDVSQTAVDLCRQRFAGDPSKRFELLTPGTTIPSGDLALSLDVLLHLVEWDVFDAHLRQLFGAATRFVAVFAPDEDGGRITPHVLYRRFTPWVEQHAAGWTLVDTVSNPYKGKDSIADLYIFRKEHEQAA